MISYIKGTLTKIAEETIVVDVSGIGYEIICPNPVVYQAQLQQEVFVHTYFHVREDVQCLYGFQHEEEKYLFTKLISVSGIGPKSALQLLASIRVPDFVIAVEREDEKYLTQFPGIGKKTARQIILDLKGKLTNVVSIEKEEVATTNAEENNDEQMSEAKEALKALGYTDKEINEIMPQLKREALTKTDEIVRKALSLLVKLR